MNDEYEGYEKNRACWEKLKYVREKLDHINDLLNERGDNNWRERSMEGTMHYLSEDLKKIPAMYHYESMNDALAKIRKIK